MKWYTEENNLKETQIVIFFFSKKHKTGNAFNFKLKEQGRIINCVRQKM